MRKKAWKTTRRNQRRRLFKSCERYIRFYKKALKEAYKIVLDPTFSEEETTEKVGALIRTANMYMDMINQNGLILPKRNTRGELCYDPE